MTALTDWISENSKIVLTAWISIVALSASGVVNLTVSSDNRVFYSEQNEKFLDLKEFEQKYIANNNIVFMLTGDESAKPNSTIPAIEWLSENAWRIESVIRVDSLSTYTLVHNSTNTELELGTALNFPCLQTHSCNLEELEVYKRQGLIGRLIGKYPEVYAVLLTLDLDINDTSEIQRIMDNVTDLRLEFASANPNVNLNFTGGIPMMAAFKTAAERDSSTLIPATLVTLFLICWWCLASYRMAGLLMLLGVTSTLFTMGLAGYYGLVLNTATAIAAIVIITLVVATSMHYASSFLNDSLIYPPDIAAHNALVVNFKPIILTTVTSVLGFLSMLYADAPPIGELGVLAAIGLIFGAVQIIIIGPILCRKVPVRNISTPSQALASHVAKSQPYARYWSLALVFIVAASSGSLALRINDDFVSYFDDSFEFRQQTNIVSKKLTGPNHIELDVTTEQVDGIFEKAYLDDIRKLSEYLRNQELVANTYSLDDIFLELSPLFSSPISEASSEEVAQIYLAYELSLAPGQSSSDFVDQFRQSSRVSVLLNDSTSAEIGSLIEDLDAWATGNLQHAFIITGENVPVSNLTKLNFTQMIKGIAISLVLAGFIVAISLKSIKLALICFFCTVAPVLAGLGLWGWMFQDIGLAAVVIIAITLGIVIDDAIHLVSRFDYYRKQGQSDNSATASKTIRLVSGAVISTTTAMVAGFSILIFSGFGINSALGACTALILALALLVDLIILPKLLQKF